LYPKKTQNNTQNNTQKNIMNAQNFNQSTTNSLFSSFV